MNERGRYPITRLPLLMCSVFLAVAMAIPFAACAMAQTAFGGISQATSSVLCGVHDEQVPESSTGVITSTSVPPGKAVNVSGSGSISAGVFYPSSGPAGWTDLAGSGYPQPAARRYSLLGRVGNGAWTYIGTGGTVTNNGNSTQKLQFRINDNVANNGLGAFVAQYTVCTNADAPAPGSWDAARVVTGPITSVAPYAVRDVFAYCNTGEVAHSGGYLEPGNATQNGLILVNGFDTNANRWFVRVKNDSGATLQIQPQVSCAPSRWSVRKVAGPISWVAPYAAKDVFASCGPGEYVLGGGYVQPGNATQNGLVLVNAHDTSSNRWFVRVKNNSPTSLQIQAQITCSPSAYSYTTNGPVTSVPPYGVKDVYAYCGLGEYRYGGGYIQPGNATQNGMVLINGFDANLNRWFVRVKNDSATPLQINAQVTCLAYIHD